MYYDNQKVTEGEPRGRVPGERAGKGGEDERGQPSIRHKPTGTGLCALGSGLALP